MGDMRRWFQWLHGTSCVHSWWPCDWCRAVQAPPRPLSRSGPLLRWVDRQPPKK